MEIDVALSGEFLIEMNEGAMLSKDGLFLDNTINGVDHYGKVTGNVVPSSSLHML